MDECDRKRSKLLDKGRVGSRCREEGSTARGEKFRFAPPPPVVSFVGEGKIGIGSMPAMDLLSLKLRPPQFNRFSTPTVKI